MITPLKESTAVTSTAELSKELRDTQDALSRTLAQNERLARVVAALRRSKAGRAVPVTAAGHGDAARSATPHSAPAVEKKHAAITAAAHSSEHSEPLRKLEEAEKQHKALLASIRALRRSLLPEAHPQASKSSRVAVRVPHGAAESAAQIEADAEVKQAKAQHAALVAQVARLEKEAARDSSEARARQQGLAQLPDPMAPQSKPAAEVDGSLAQAKADPSRTAVQPTAEPQAKEDAAYRDELAAGQLLAQAKR